MQLFLKRSGFVVAIVALQFSSLAMQKKEKEYNRRIMAQRAPEYGKEPDLWNGLGILRQVCPSYALAADVAGNLKDTYSCSHLDEMLKHARYSLLWQEKAKIEQQAYNRVINNSADDEEYEYAATYQPKNNWLRDGCNICWFSKELKTNFDDIDRVVNNILHNSKFNTTEDRKMAKVMVWKRFHRLANQGRDEAESLGINVSKH